jgi:hypothetical protein
MTIVMMPFGGLELLWMEARLHNASMLGDLEENGK